MCQAVTAKSRSFGASSSESEVSRGNKAAYLQAVASWSVFGVQAGAGLDDNQNFVFRGEYEFASDPRSFFNEEDPAILRMSRSFAESIVSTLINGFGVNDEK